MRLYFQTIKRKTNEREFLTIDTTKQFYKYDSQPYCKMIDKELYKAEHIYIDEADYMRILRELDFNSFNYKEGL